MFVCMCLEKTQQIFVVSFSRSRIGLCAYTKMAKRFLFLAWFALLSLMLDMVSCGTWTTDANDIRHPGKCAIHGLLLAAGEEHDPKDECVKYICGEGSVVTGFNCGSRTVSDCEDLGYADVSKPYPDCCVKKFKCIVNGKEELTQF